MAEEKIRVLVAKDPCENCKLKPCARKCIFVQMYEKGPAIAKSDAIEKMAKAICYKETRNKTCKGCPCENDRKKSIYWKAAKAALKALLEE